LANPRVSLCFIGKAVTLPEWYSVDFASAVVTGTASPVTDEDEKMKAMKAILKRHAPGNSDARNDVQFEACPGRRFGASTSRTSPARPAAPPNGKPERA
ncbi:MAG: pyridoxamine 5'-phosphate oxidase family protein, partial [Sutterella sp.]